MNNAARCCALFLCLLSPLGGRLHSQPGREKGLEAITVEAVRGQLEFLASDWTEGRNTAEKGAFLASDYIASMFRVYGLAPGGDAEERQGGRRMRSPRPSAEPPARTYFQNINFIESTPGERQELGLTSADGRTITFNYRTDFTVDIASVGQEISGPVVFVGYGMTDEKNRYDDFDGVDVRGKFILRFTGYPGYTDTASAAYKKFRPDSMAMEFSRERDKNAAAKKAGAAGIIEINLRNDPVRRWSTNVPFRVNLPYYEGDAPLSPSSEPRLTLPLDTLRKDLSVISLSRRAAAEFLDGSGIALETFDRQAQERMKPASRPLKGKSVRLSTTVQSKIVTGRNVIGILEGERKDQVVVIGAHYDHVGMRQGYIWNGADDNASGTVGVMTAAKAWTAAGVRPKNTIIFAAWTGEEKGLLGSEYFVARPPVPLGQIIAYINYDMIARNATDDSLGVRVGGFFTQAYPELKEMSEKNNADAALGLELRMRGSERPGGGSDHASFAAKDVPVLGFMAAMHADYHLPGDDVSKVNWKKMTAIIKLGFLDLWQLAGRDGKLQAVRQESSRPSR